MCVCVFLRKKEKKVVQKKEKKKEIQLSQYIPTIEHARTHTHNAQ